MWSKWREEMNEEGWARKGIGGRDGEEEVKWEETKEDEEMNSWKKRRRGNEGGDGEEEWDRVAL